MSETESKSTKSPLDFGPPANWTIVTFDWFHHTQEQVTHTIKVKVYEKEFMKDIVTRVKHHLLDTDPTLTKIKVDQLSLWYNSVFEIVGPNRCVLLVSNEGHCLGHKMDVERRFVPNHFTISYDFS